MLKHWSDEDLIDRLYDAGREDPHLDECEGCRARWLELLERRQQMLEEPDVPADFLAAQRREIYQRLDSAEHAWPFRLAPALAAMAAVVLGIVLSLPAPPPQPTLALNDTFYTEIYSMVESPEPAAAEPIYALFEVQTEVQP